MPFEKSNSRALGHALDFKNLKNCNQISTLDMNMLIKRRLKLASSSENAHRHLYFCFTFLVELIALTNVGLNFGGHAKISSKKYLKSYTVP